MNDAVRASRDAYDVERVRQDFPILGERPYGKPLVMEHHSNIVPWHFHRERKGAVLRWVDIGDDGSFSMEAFKKALNERTRIVAITQMSNVLGTAPPIKEVIRLAHQRGVPVLVDGSQGAVHLDIDVRDLGADFYVFTGHKVYGPTGIFAAIYGGRGDDRGGRAGDRDV